MFVKNKQIRQLGILTSCLVLAACMMGPDYHAPDAPTTRQYDRHALTKTVSAPKAGAPGKTQFFVYGKDVPAEWWYLYHSPELNYLIEKGLANSPNFAAAKAALLQAQENYNAQFGSTMLPAVNGQLQGTRQRFSSVEFGAPNARTLFNLVNVGVPVSYTFDFFGANRRQLEAMAAQIDYSQYQLDAAYLTLTSSIVTTAITEASIRAQIEATYDIIRSQEKQLAIIRKQVKLGGASGADALAQETQMQQTRATLPPLEQSFAQAHHMLAVLVGQLPSEANLPEFRLDELRLPTHLPVSMPSQLVRQRPDIRAAEALLHAACAQVGVATANLYPQFNLTGLYSYTEFSFNGLFSPNNRVWNVALAITEPLYAGGSLMAKKRAAVDGFNMAAAQYRQVVLQAFQNVADTMRALEHDAQVLEAQKSAEIAARDSLRINERQYRLGGVSYLALLNAQRQYQQTRINRIQAQAARYNDTAALFQAMGGGWWNDRSLAANGR